jgi:hypothetical protein
MGKESGIKIEGPKKLRSMFINVMFPLFGMAPLGNAKNVGYGKWPKLVVLYIEGIQKQ